MIDIRTARYNSRNDDSNSNGNLSTAVVKELEQLSFRAFQQCIVLWLRAKGFRHLQSLKRQHRRGRRSVSGIDFVAVLPGTATVTLAIQLRHWRTSLQRRAVDEMWGHLLRKGIPAGLIICNCEVSKTARTIAEQYPGRPIEVISVRQLAHSLIAVGMGVDQTARSVDRAFFRSLEQLSFASSMIHQTSTVCSVCKPKAVGQSKTRAYEAAPSSEEVERHLLIICWTLVGLCLILVAAFFSVLFGGG